MALTPKADVLAAIATRDQEKEVTGVGTFRIREVTLDESIKLGKAENHITAWISYCVLDEAGAQMFAEADIEALRRGASPRVMALFGAVMEVNGKDLMALFRLGESSAETSLSDSASDSPSLSASPST